MPPKEGGGAKDPARGEPRPEGGERQAAAQERGGPGRERRPQGAFTIRLNLS